MELLKCLLVVVAAAVVCDTTPQTHWLHPPQKSQSSFHFQQPEQQSKVPPPPSDKCAVVAHEKIECGTPDLTAEQCESIDCCFDGQQCYYGNAVTVQCTFDGQFVVVVAKESTQPPLDMHLVSLLKMDNEVCNPLYATSAFAVYQFPVTLCGTTVKEEDGFIVYENHMASAYEVGIGPRGSISRDSHFESLFQCRYSGTAVEALILEVNPVPAPVPVSATGPLGVELRVGSGRCHYKGCAEDVAAYSSFYSPEDFPITKKLQDSVYIEVRLLERSDPNIVLNLEHCWATSTPNPGSEPQWDLLIDGCPYHDDHYQTIVIPVDDSAGLEYPTHHKRFIIKMFTFVDSTTLLPLQDMVFIHCSTSVCYPSSMDSCVQHCHRQRDDTDEMFT
ncbi:zona pellucida sperm-binding protein 4-like [Pholidichthys leucotaenia]